MNQAAAPTLRWARAFLLAGVVVGAGGIAHASAGGLLPGPVGLLVLLATCAAGCAVFLGREASTSRLVALVVAGQAYVHTVLAATAGHRGDPAATATQGQGPEPAAIPLATWNPRTGESYERWAQHLAGAQDASLTLPPWLGHGLADVTAHPLMAVAHLVGAVVVGAWLSVGERALWAVIAIAATGMLRLVRQLGAALGGLVVGDHRARLLTVVIASLAPPPVRDVWSRGPIRRGPPLLLVVR